AATTPVRSGQLMRRWARVSGVGMAADTMRRAPAARRHPGGSHLAQRPLPALSAAGHDNAPSTGLLGRGGRGAEAHRPDVATPGGAGRDQARTERAMLWRRLRSAAPL